MSNPLDAESFTHLLAEFMRRSRRHLAQLAESGDPETIERFFAIVSGAAAAVLLLMPNKRNGLVSNLLAFMQRFLGGKKL